jgi:rhodanese-related sulfurtransferase
MHISNMLINNYNQTLINTLWNYKVSFVFFVGLTAIGYLSLPYLNDVQEDLEKKIKHKDQLLNIEELKERLDSFDVILDVRSEAEFSKGHVDLSNVIHIDHNEILIQENSKLLNKNGITKNKSILVYCNSGNRASKVVQHMIEELGYSRENIFLTKDKYISINKVI